MNYLPLSDCKNSYLYKVRARNFSLGIYRDDTKGFVGIREKFGKYYLDLEYHYDTGEPFGTCIPIEEIEQCPIDKLDTGFLQDGFFVTNKELFGWLDKKVKEYKSNIDGKDNF